MHAHNQKTPHTMGGWWAVHENGPSDTSVKLMVYQISPLPL